MRPLLDAVSQTNHYEDFNMKKLSVLALTTIAVLSTSAVLAKPNKDEHQPPFALSKAKMDKRVNPEFKGLNSTDEQKAKIQQIQADSRAAFKKKQENRKQEMADWKKRNEQYRAEQEKLVTSKNFDEHAARQLIEKRHQEQNKLNQDRVEAELQHMKDRHAMFQVLTPAQQKQFLENKQKRQEKFAKMQKERQEKRAKMQKERKNKDK